MNKNVQKYKKKGGTLYMYNLVPEVDDSRLLVWKTIPKGALVLYTNNKRPQNYGIYQVTDGPSLLSLYTLVNISDPTRVPLKCHSHDFRIIVQNTNINDKRNKFFGLITGYGTIGAVGYIYVTGLDDNGNCIYISYASNEPDLHNKIVLITNDDINHSRITDVNTFELFFKKMDSYMNVSRDDIRNCLINLRILNEPHVWIIPNTPISGFNFGIDPGGPSGGPTPPPFGPFDSSSLNSQLALSTMSGNISWGESDPNYHYPETIGNHRNITVAEYDRLAQIIGSAFNKKYNKATVLTKEEKDKRLNDWIEIQNKIVVKDQEIDPVTRNVIPPLLRSKTFEEIQKEQNAANELKIQFLKDIKEKRDINLKTCPVCLETFFELSQKDSPDNEIYSCKNFHPVCGNCKNKIDSETRIGGYLWEHRDKPIWKCVMCKHVSKNADRLFDLEQAYRDIRQSGGSSTIYKNVGKKEILGKDRIIYKMKGSNKEYVKYKGIFIHVTEYKKLKSKNNKNK